MEKKNMKAVVNDAPKTQSKTLNFEAMTELLTHMVSVEEMLDTLEYSYHTLMGYILSDEFFRGGGREVDDFYYIRLLINAIRTCDPDAVYCPKNYDL